MFKNYEDEGFKYILKINDDNSDVLIFETMGIDIESYTTSSPNEFPIVYLFNLNPDVITWLDNNTRRWRFNERGYMFFIHEEDYIKFKLKFC